MTGAATLNEPSRVFKIGEIIVEDPVIFLPEVVMKSLYFFQTITVISFLGVEKIVTSDYAVQSSYWTYHPGYPLVGIKSNEPYVRQPVRG